MKSSLNILGKNKNTEIFVNTVNRYRKNPNLLIMTVNK